MISNTVEFVKNLRNNALFENENESANIEENMIIERFQQILNLM